jgi:hypothetical protein
MVHGIPVSPALLAIAASAIAKTEPNQSESTIDITNKTRATTASAILYQNRKGLQRDLRLGSGGTLANYQRSK